jgi:hypothetical protein
MSDDQVSSLAYCNRKITTIGVLSLILGAVDMIMTTTESTMRMAVTRTPVMIALTFLRMTRAKTIQNPIAPTLKKANLSSYIAIWTKKPT